MSYSVCCIAICYYCVKLFLQLSVLFECILGAASCFEKDQFQFRVSEKVAELGNEIASGESNHQIVSETFALWSLRTLSQNFHLESYCRHLLCLYRVT